MVNNRQTSFSPHGLATGIGSLPFTDPEQAMALIDENLPDIPHWPQLPRKGIKEHFVHQCLQPLVDCGMLIPRADGWIFNACGSNTADCLTDFYTTCLPAEGGSKECLRSFLPSRDAAAGFHAFLDRFRADSFAGKAGYVKGQIVGPLTAGLELKDEEGRPAYYQGDLRDIIVRALALNARCQAAALAASGCTPIIFVDDPVVRAWGSRLHLALKREMIIEDLDFIFSAVRSQGALTGIHSCEAVDWSLLLESQARILSLDAYRYGNSLLPYSAQLKRFLERGGVIAWGIVPTTDDPFRESVDSLTERLKALWDELGSHGLDRGMLLWNSMITPSCGTGLLTREKAIRIYQLTSALSRSIRQMPG